MFYIDVDRFKNSLTITFEEMFWSPDILAKFQAEIASALQTLNPRPGTHLVLVDLRNAVIQSQDTVAAAQKLLGASTAARIALVASSALARMQTKRLQIRENVILFDDLDAAKEWLFESQAVMST